MARTFARWQEIIDVTTSTSSDDSINISHTCRHAQLNSLDRRMQKSPERIGFISSYIFTSYANLLLTLDSERPEPTLPTIVGEACPITTPQNKPTCLIGGIIPSTSTVWSYCTYSYRLLSLQWCSLKAGEMPMRQVSS